MEGVYNYIGRYSVEACMVQHLGLAWPGLALPLVTLDTTSLLCRDDLACFVLPKAQACTCNLAETYHRGDRHLSLCPQGRGPFSLISAHTSFPKAEERAWCGVACVPAVLPVMDAARQRWTDGGGSLKMYGWLGVVIYSWDGAICNAWAPALPPCHVIRPGRQSSVVVRSLLLIGTGSDGRWSRCLPVP